MAACYGNITSDNVEHLDEDDADALEAAFDKSFTAAPAIKETAPKADDPLATHIEHHALLCFESRDTQTQSRRPVNANSELKTRCKTMTAV